MSKQLSGKPKEIGKCKGKSIYGVLTKGGLSLVAQIADSGDLKVLGAGSHRMIARCIALQENPDIQFNELSKSDSTLPNDVLQKYLPQFIELTHKMQSISNDVK